jgi:hypothetical protein
VTEFAIRNLSVLSYAQGFTSWHYRVHGPLDAALAPEFFSTAHDMLAHGDMLMISATDHGAHVFVRKDGQSVSVAVMART